MKKFVTLLFISLLSGLLFLSSCKKKDDTSEQTENGYDASLVQSDFEDIVSEVNDALNANTNTNSRTSSGNNLCNVTIDSTHAATGTLILTFNGNNCISTKTRTGVITIQLNAPYNWSAAGAVATVTISNFMITTLHQYKTIVINGTKTITNVSGGRITDLVTGTGAVVHTVTSSNMSVQLDNGITRTWNVARRRTITKESTGYNIKVEGIANQGGYSQVADWGTNRKGNLFYSTISSPVNWNKDAVCESGPISGQRIIYGTVHELTIDFGVTQFGDPFIGSGGSCPYGYKIHWTGRRGKNYEHVFSY